MFNITPHRGTENKTTATASPAPRKGCRRAGALSPAWAWEAVPGVAGRGAGAALGGGRHVLMQVNTATRGSNHAAGVPL